MKVSVVIPNWNGCDKLRKNLPSVLRVQGIYEVIVVDDCSTDASVAMVKTEFPQVRLVEKKKNEGFSSTVNLGVEESKGEFVFLLNSDAKPDEACLKYVMSHFEDPKVFSVGFNTGGSWAWANFEKGFLRHGQCKDNNTDAHETLWVSGGSGVFRKSIWHELSGLDELFNPFYVEDLDLGFRATKSGYTNIWEPRALVEHYKQKGVIEENFKKSFVVRIAERNNLIFIWKNITSYRLLLSHLIWLVLRLVREKGYFLPLFLALAKLPSVFAKRKRTVKQFRLSDDGIFGKYRLS